MTTVAVQHGDPRVVGRDAELGDAARFVDALATGPAAMLVEGEAGSGKTTVWRAAGAAAAGRGYRVLSSVAVDTESDLPFVGLRDLLEPVAAAAASELPPVQRAALDVALLRSDDPAAVADQHAVCVAVLGVVRALAAQGPLVIAVDDVGWMDRSSDRVLRYVIRRLTSEPVGVLAARRPAVDPSVPDGGVPLGLDGPPIGEMLHRVELGPLDPAALHAMLERAGLDLPRRTTRHIHRLCAGNPFHAVEIARAVLGGSQRVLTEAELPLPGGVLAVTAQRMAALTPASRHALGVASMVAAPTVSLVRAVVGDHAIVGLEEAAAEGLLEITGAGVGFTHPLLRSAAAANLSAGERRALHRELATVVTDPDERAVHLAAGATGPDEAVAQALDGAARRAFAQGAAETAAALADRSVSLTPADAADALARRGIDAAHYYYYRIEDAATARSRLEAVIAQLPASSLRAEALLWLAVCWHGHSVAEQLGRLRIAIDEAGDDGIRAAAQRTLAVDLVIAGDPAAADRQAAAALRTARAGTDPASIAESCATLAWTRFWTGRGLRTDLLDASGSSRDWTRFAPNDKTSGLLAGLLLGWADRFDPARAALDAELVEVRDRGLDQLQCYVLFNLSELESRAGNWDRALAHAVAGRRVAALVEDELGSALLGYAVGLAHAHLGRLDIARAEAAAAVAAGQAIGSQMAVGFGMALLGFVELSAGDHAAVHRHVGPLAATVPADGSFDPGLVRFVPDEVEALVKLGERAQAKELLAPFEAQALALDRPWALGAAGRCRALLLADAGDIEAALGAVAAALAAHDRVAMPFERARTLLVAGSVRRRARRRGEARVALVEALAEFDRLGATAWAGQVTAEIGRLGGRVTSARALTGTEERIAELVAAGRSNREVAATLFVTVSTVEAALWKIYRKLDVRSRTELAARLAGREVR